MLQLLFQNANLNSKMIIKYFAFLLFFYHIIVKTTRKTANPSEIHNVFIVDLVKTRELCTAFPQCNRLCHPNSGIVSILPHKKKASRIREVMKTLNFSRHQPHFL